MHVPDPGWQALVRGLDGEFFTPDSPGYDEARKPPIPRFHDVRPAAVLRCRSEADAVAAVSIAANTGLPTTVRCGGHSFAGLSSTEGLLIDVSDLDTVELKEGVARTGAGARLAKVYNVLHGHGLTVPAGCGPTVGIGGLTLGGGLGVLGRMHGLTCDQLRGARVVLADGTVVECDEHREPDLFWMLRGGGSPGIVTRLDLQTVQEPVTTTFHMTWPASATAAVIAGWQAWAPDGPDEMSASLLVTAGPDPRRTPTPNVFGAVHERGPADATPNSELLDDLVARVGVAPTSRASQTTSYRRAKQRLVEIGGTFGTQAHGHDAEHRHGYHKSEYFDPSVPEEAIETVTELLAQRPPGVGCELDLMPWGGAYNRVAPEATAFVHRGDRVLIRYAVSVAPAATAGERAVAHDWLHLAWSALHPHGTGRAYQNFPDPELDDQQRAYYGDNLERIHRVRAGYDPAGIFSSSATAG